MKKPHKKLNLHFETVRLLEDPRLPALVAAGWNTQVCGMTSKACFQASCIC